MENSALISTTRQAPASGFANRAIKHLVGMDRTDEFYLVTAVLCAFGSALAAQKRNA